MKPVAPRLRRILYIVGGVLLASAAVWAGLHFGGGGPPAPPEEPPKAPVKWMEARQFFVEEWTEALGTTQALPERAARVTAPTEGQVVSVLQGAKGQTFAEGQPIKKGDVIVELDARHAKAQRDKAAATLEELKQLTKQADITAKLADLDVRRLTELTQTGPGAAQLPLVSKFELEKAMLVQQDAAAKLKAAEFREHAGEKELEAQDEHLMLHTLTAPIDGRLGRLLVVLGQTISPGTVVADIVNVDDKIDVLCFVPPHVAKRFHQGQPARIGAVDEKPLAGTANPEGRIEFIADQAELDTGNVAVKIRFPNTELGLRVNTTVRLRVLTSPGKACLTLPEAAVFEDQDPPTVMVVENHKVETIEGKEVETGTVRRLQAKLGVRDRSLHLVEIISLYDPEGKWHGTLEEARFVFERGRGLRTGDPVQLQVED